MFARSREWTVSRPHDADEIAADRAADAVLARLGAPVAAGPEPTAAGPVPAAFSRAFGRGFPAVRLRTDPAAAAVAAGLQAHAVTIGNQVLFGAGAYRPDTPGGRRLLAHELAHVAQGERDGRPRIRRAAYGCTDLMASAGAASLLPGREVHRIIQEDFSKVAGATSIAIPGGSATPLRTDALCGGDSKVIPPQPIGGRAGLGFPDLARRKAAGALGVAEIKPAVLPCLVDGEQQLLRYLEQGNADDPEQQAWRAASRVSAVVPMGAGDYEPPVFVRPPLVIRAGWCLPGLMGYVVYRTPPPILVPQEVRDRERERLAEEARRRKLLIAGGAVVAGVAGRALWRHFWKAVVQRFAVRLAAAAILAAADGPLPFGELVDLGIGIATVVEIGIGWNELWRIADQIAADEA